MCVEKHTVATAPDTPKPRGERYASWVHLELCLMSYKMERWCNVMGALHPLKRPAKVAAAPLCKLALHNQETHHDSEH